MLAIQKKKIVLIMNCHAQEVKAYLSSSEAIDREYTISIFYTYTVEKLENRSLIYEATKNADVLITQNVENIVWLRNDYIASYMKRGCILIRLAFWRFNGYWPVRQETYTSSFQYLPTEAGEITNFEDYINFSIPSSLTTNYYESELLKLSEIDRASDIKMMPFFLSNHKNFNLLSDSWHPTSYFFFGLTKTIISHLGFTPNIRLRPNSLINHNRYRFVFNTVANTLGLNYDFSYLRFFDHTIHRETFFEFSRFMIRHPRTIDMEQLAALFYTWAEQEGLTVRQVDMAGLGSHRGRRSSIAAATVFSFHAAPEPLPSWDVDLREIREVSEIAIWNRGGDGRLPGLISTTLIVSISVDNAEWYTVQTTTFCFGNGGSASPLRISLGGETMVRYIKLQVEGSNNFHVDKIEAFAPVLG